MEIRQYLRILRRRLWIPLGFVLITALVTGVWTILSKPAYIATATVIAKSQSGGSTTPALSFLEVATSNNLGLRVHKQLGLRGSVDDLTGKIKVSAGRSDLYTVSVSDGDPARATVLANAVANEACRLYQELAVGSQGSIVNDLQGDRTTVQDHYSATAKALLDFRRQHPDAANTTDATVGAQYLRLQMDERAASQAYIELEQDLTRARVDEITKTRSNALDFQARVVDEAVAKPDTTGRFMKIEYGIAVALVLGVGIIAALEYFDNSVREPEDVEELIDAPIVGIIPRSRSAALRPAQRNV